MAFSRYADDENDMVLDPHLGKHLAHWGINMMQVSQAGTPLPQVLVINKDIGSGSSRAPFLPVQHPLKIST